MKAINNSITKSQFSNYLGLFNEEGKALPSKTADFLDISLNKLAKALGLDTLRSDRLGPIGEQRVQELAATLEMVASSFGGNEKKAKFWINTPNFHLGASIPKDLILIGKYKKVYDFVVAARDE